MKTITMTAWKRPDLTQQVLDSLAECIGIEDYKLLAFVEPGCERVVEIFEKFNACDKQIVVNERVFGIAENTKQALDAAFKIGEYNIHIEDDTVLLPNALNFFEWCGESFKNEHHVGTCCAYSGNTSASLPSHVIAHRWFGCWAWSTWKSRWDKSLKEDWGGNMSRFAAHVNGWQFKEKYLQIYPVQSLCINIGIGDGRATNGKNEVKKKINAHYGCVPVTSFEMIEKQENSKVQYTKEGMSPSESVICVQFCNKLNNTPTLLLGCNESIITEHINITKDTTAKQAIFNYDAFPEATFDVIIVVQPTDEKSLYLKHNGYFRQYTVRDKVGIERWIKK